MAASTLSQVTLTANVEAPIIGANPRRTRIGFTFSGTSGGWFRPDSQGNTAGGIAISLAAGRIDLSVAEHGDIVKGPWQGFCVGGTTPIFGILETID